MSVSVARVNGTWCFCCDGGSFPVDMTRLESFKEILHILPKQAKLAFWIVWNRTNSVTATESQKWENLLQELSKRHEQL